MLKTDLNTIFIQKRKIKTSLNTSFQKFNFSIESEIGNDHYQKQFSRQFALEHALLLLLPSTIEEAPPFIFSSSYPHHGARLDTLYSDPIHVRGLFPSQSAS